MIQVNIDEAKTNLSKIIDQTCRGEEVVIAKAGTPVVRLSSRRQFGALSGKARVDKRFFEPFPKDELRAWE